MGQIISFPCYHGYRGNCPHCGTCQHGVAGRPCPACGPQPAGQVYAELAPRLSHAQSAGQAYGYLAPRLSHAQAAGELTLNTGSDSKALYIALAAVAAGLIGYAVWKKNKG